MPRRSGPAESDLAVAAITVRRGVVLVLRGALWPGSCGELAAALDEAFADHPKWVVVDASGITRCDSAGLTPVVEAADHAPGRGVRVVMSGLHHRYHRLLPVDCTDDLFYPTVGSALSAVRDHFTPHPEQRPRGELLAEIRSLRGILASRAVIEQAKGALLVSHGHNADAAFDLLRRYSQQHNVRVTDLAERLVRALDGQSGNPVTRARMDRLLTDIAVLPIDS